MNREEIILNNRPLINFIINQLNLQYEREDLYSIGMIGLIKAIDTFNPEKSKLSTYLYTCIRHEILSSLRKKRVSTVSMETPIENNLTLEDAIGDDYDFTKEIEENELLNEVYDNLNELKPREKEMLIKYYGLFDTKKYTQMELAKMYGVSQRYICVALDKSRKKLKELVEI